MADLFPLGNNGIYGVLTTDEMHILKLGLLPKLTRMFDSLMIRSFEHGDGFKKYEDVHQRLEYRLQLVPAMCDGRKRLILLRAPTTVSATCQACVSRLTTETVIEPRWVNYTVRVKAHMCFTPSIWCRVGVLRPNRRGVVGGGKLLVSVRVGRDVHAADCVLRRRRAADPGQSHSRARCRDSPVDVLDLQAAAVAPLGERRDDRCV